MNAASIHPDLIEALVRRARELIAIKCYGAAAHTLDFLQDQLKYGVQP